MDIYQIFNMAAWGLCGLFAFLLIADCIKVEKTRSKEEPGGKGGFIPDENQPD